MILFEYADLLSLALYLSLFIVTFVPVVFLLVELRLQLVEMNLPRGALFHLLDQEVVPLSPNYVIYFLIFTRLFPPFSLFQSKFLTLLDQFFQCLGVVLCEVGKHILILTDFYLLLVFSDRIITFILS